MIEIKMKIHPIINKLAKNQEVKYQKNRIN